jgi:PAS domain S-box-containing protein
VLKRRSKRPLSAAANARRCANLYRLIRLRLGDEPSDREIARQWGLEWKSFAELKHGRRAVPRVADLERLAELLELDPVDVFQAARGLDAAGILEASRTPSRLAASLARLRDAVLTLDERGVLHDFNPALGELTGRTPSELRGGRFLDLVDAESLPQAVQAIALAVKETKPQRAELTVRGPREARRRVVFEVVPLPSTVGAPSAVQAVMRDVTDERLLVRSLEEERRLLREVFAHLPVACLVFEPSGVVAAASGRLEEVSPLLTEEVIGRRRPELLGRSGGALAPVARAFKSGQVEHTMGWAENRSGEPVYVHRSACPIFVGATISRVIELWLDMTAHLQQGDVRLLGLWSEHDRRRPRRRSSPRVRAAFQARLRHQGKELEVAVENVAAGGLFVRSELDVAARDAVELEWNLPHAATLLKTRGVVAWARRKSRHRPAGFGVRFLEVVAAPTHTAG